MENHRLPENVILIKLSSCDPKIAEELKELNETLSQKSDCDVVLDFSYVEIINSSNISNLLILRSFLENNGRKLIFHNVKTIAKCIFVVAGLADYFVFMDDMNDVFKAIQKETCTKK
ncbi:MAG: anti-sigma factor antagonist [Sedimentisphaerales bacterium]|nr:anti-sigma factor antagonist [Sedimentisphaerales bacterium]